MLPTSTHRLLSRIAKLYYEGDMTQIQIARRLRLSRQKVQRLLRQAREQGVVRISFPPLPGLFDDLEQALEERFGLREAVVVETSNYEHQPTVAREIGANGAAAYVARVVQAGDSIVISWGGTLLEMVNGLAYQAQKVSGATIIQGLGGLGDPTADRHAGELVRRMAGYLGAGALPLPAPGVAGSRAARDAFMDDFQVKNVLDRARKAKLAVMGIGVPRRDSILVSEGAIVQLPELQRLVQSGAVGDINLRYFDAGGKPVASGLDDRVIGLTLEEIRQIPIVVGVAGGAQKLEAIRAAVSAGMLSVLITDNVTARKLLEIETAKPKAGDTSRRAQSSVSR